MDSTRPLSSATDWFTWPLQYAQLAANAFQTLSSSRIAPDFLAQPINPGWTFNVNSNNSSAPETEQTVVMQHSYGRQLGRLMDAVDLLVEDLEARQPALSGNERLADFRRLKADIDDIKARAAERRVERFAAELEALSRTNQTAYRNLRQRLRELVRE
jgi:hypothetical protein